MERMKMDGEGMEWAGDKTGEWMRETGLRNLCLGKHGWVME